MALADHSDEKNCDKDTDYNVYDEPFSFRLGKTTGFSDVEKWKIGNTTVGGTGYQSQPVQRTSSEIQPKNDNAVSQHDKVKVKENNRSDAKSIHPNLSDKNSLKSSQDYTCTDDNVFCGTENQLKLEVTPEYEPHNVAPKSISSDSQEKLLEEHQGLGQNNGTENQLKLEVTPEDEPHNIAPKSISSDSQEKLPEDYQGLGQDNGTENQLKLEVTPEYEPHNIAPKSISSDSKEKLPEEHQGLGQDNGTENQLKLEVTPEYEPHNIAPKSISSDSKEKLPEEHQGLGQDNRTENQLKLEVTPEYEPHNIAPKSISSDSQEKLPEEHQGLGQDNSHWVIGFLVILICVPVSNITAMPLMEKGTTNPFKLEVTAEYEPHTIAAKSIFWKTDGREKLQEEKQGLGQDNELIFVYLEDTNSIKIVATPVESTEGTPKWTIKTDNETKIVIFNGIVKSEFRGKIHLENGTTIHITNLSFEEWMSYWIYQKGFDTPIRTKKLTEYFDPLCSDNFTVVDSSTTSITVKWDSGIDRGHEMVTILQYRVEGSSDWMSVYNTTVHYNQEVNFTIPDLEQGTSYDLRLWTVGANGSNPICKSHCITQKTKPAKLDHEVIESVNTNLIPAVVVGLCVCLILAFVILVSYRCWRRYQKYNLVRRQPNEHDEIELEEAVPSNKENSLNIFLRH